MGSLVGILIVCALVCKASAQVHPTLQQYIQNYLTGSSYHSTPAAPPVPLLPPPGKPAPQIPHQKPCPAKNPLAYPQNIPLSPTRRSEDHRLSKEVLGHHHEPAIDSKVLNNLAVAVQLMVLHNLLNKPEAEEKEAAKPLPVSYSQQPAPVSLSYAPEPQYTEKHEMPSASFLGSGFVEPSIGSFSGFDGMGMVGSKVPLASAARSGFSLMSPYEALNPGSPYNDPILSKHGSFPSTEFQSPYSMMSDSSSDLFSF